MQIESHRCNLKISEVVCRCLQKCGIVQIRADAVSWIQLGNVGHIMAIHGISMHISIMLAHLIPSRSCLPLFAHLVLRPKFDYRRQ